MIRMRLYFLPMLALCLALIFVGGAVKAAEPKEIGSFQDWSSYVLIEEGSKVCYMVSRPIKAEGNYSKRGDIFALITHRPAQNTKDVFSYITGYGYKSGSDASVAIDTRPDHYTRGQDVLSGLFTDTSFNGSRYEASYE